MNYLRHFCLVSLFLLTAIYPGLAAKHYDYIFSSLPGGLSIDRCLFTDTATIVSIAWQSPVDGMVSFSSAIYASDEQDRRYKIIRSEGLTPNQKNLLDANRLVEFTLYFEPLPRDTKIFDIYMGTRYNGFSIFGIHNTRAKLKIPVAKEAIDEAELAPLFWQTDTVVIRGHITDYNRTMPHIANERFENQSNDYAKINADGTFQLAMPLNHTQWNEISLAFQRYIPVYVHPGDTVDIQIDHYGKWNETFAYHNVNGHQTCERLMRIHENYLRNALERLNNSNSYAAYISSINSLQATAERLMNYWAWKYKMTPWESHLMKNYWRVERVIMQEDVRNKQIFRFNKTSHHYTKGDSIDNLDDLYNSDYLYEIVWDSAMVITPTWNDGIGEQLRDRYKIAVPGCHLRSPKAYRISSNAPKWDTYDVRSARAQVLIDSLAERSFASYTELLLVSPYRTVNYHLGQFLDKGLEFEGEHFHFMIVVSEGRDKNKLRNMLNTIFETSRSKNFDADIVTIDEEDMIELQAALHSILLPAQATITRDGKVLRSTLSTYGDQARDKFIELAEYDKKADK